MFLRPAYYRHAEFRVGVRDMLPTLPGLAAWGLMTGVAMVKSGMSGFEAVMMTLLVFAGSAQLAAIPLIVAGAPIWVIVAASACVNLRFVVFSAHLRGYLMYLPRLERMVSGFLTTDLTYVLFVRRFPQPADEPDKRVAEQAYLAGNSFVNWLNWCISSLLGIALAHLIPTAWGLGFAGVLVLLAITCSMATSRLRILSALVAGGVAVVVYSLPLKLNVLLAIASAVAVCLALEKPAPIPPPSRTVTKAGDA